MGSMLLPVNFSGLSSHPFSNRGIVKQSILIMLNCGFSTFIASTPLISTTGSIKISWFAIHDLIFPKPWITLQTWTVWFAIFTLNYTWCENFMIFLSVRFYVKLIFGDSGCFDITFYCNFMGSELCYFAKYQASKSAKIEKIKIQSL